MQFLPLLLLTSLLACSKPATSSTPGGADTPVRVEPADVPQAVAAELDCPADEIAFTKVDVGEVTLNVACRGSGPTIVLLHGFPEFWYGWKGVIDRLAKDFRVVAPDGRGYNLSDKPAGVSAYTLEHLDADVAGLLAKLGPAPVLLVGHDWGGALAWYVAHRHPELLEGLVILNAPHMDVFRRELAENPKQKEASAYIDLFVTPGSEDAFSANDFGLLSQALPIPPFTAEELTAYKAAWGQPGALTAMLNWYRASFAKDATPPANVTIDVPTLVLWGMKDTALLTGNLVGLDTYVKDLEIKEYPEATHWIAHEAPDDVVADIRAFRAGLPHVAPPPPADEDAPDAGSIEDTTPPPPEDAGPPPPEDVGLALPPGLKGQKAPEGKGLPEFSAVKDTTKALVTSAELTGHWTVMWFYPAASTAG